jgi:hypothetical protein
VESVEFGKQFTVRAGPHTGNFGYRDCPSIQTDREKLESMSTSRVSQLTLAAAAAVMFSTGAINTAAAEEGKVKCEGVNSCKGTSACATAENSCKGMNSCAGHGWLDMTKAECDAAKAKMEKEQAAKP